MWYICMCHAKSFSHSITFVVSDSKALKLEFLFSGDNGQYFIVATNLN